MLSSATLVAICCKSPCVTSWLCSHLQPRISWIPRSFRLDCRQTLCEPRQCPHHPPPLPPPPQSHLDNCSQPLLPHFELLQKIKNQLSIDHRVNTAGKILFFCYFKAKISLSSIVSLKIKLFWLIKLYLEIKFRTNSENLHFYWSFNRNILCVFNYNWIQFST